MRTKEGEAGPELRVLVGWRALPGYLCACLEALARQAGVKVLVYCEGEGAFPNVLPDLASHANLRLLSPGSDEAVLGAGREFQPQVAVLSLRRGGTLGRLAAGLRPEGTLVVGACDHFWRGTWRDQANRLAAALGAFSSYDALWVPGSWGKRYGRKLGFPEPRIFDGVYTCDTAIFRPVGRDRHLKAPSAAWPPVFLFVGQYIRRKGVDTLLAAYQQYRRLVSHPWELWLVGQGELQPALSGERGVRDLGRKEAAEIAALMAEAGCLVLPSRWDHWGLVVHEACCAGLPVLASSRCGAAVELVQAGWNGFVFPPEAPELLARLMAQVSQDGGAREMGRNSLCLSGRYSPGLWVRKLCLEIPLVLRGEPFRLLKADDPGEGEDLGVPHACCAFSL